MYLDLSAAIAPVAAAMRHRIIDVRRWALSQGRPVDADVVALILAGKMSWRDEPPDRWTRVGVYGNLYADVPNLCSAHGELRPISQPEVLWTYLSYLHETTQFDPGSDPLRELRKPLRCYGGLGPDGFKATENTPRVKCVCKVPYRRRPARRQSEAG
ncbi:MAG: hypothetical protein ACRD1D_02695 [Acidimicrobiales bacterium]